MCFHLSFHSLAEGVHVEFVQGDGRDQRLFADLKLYVLHEVIQ